MKYQYTTRNKKHIKIRINAFTIKFTAFKNIFPEKYFYEIPGFLRSCHFNENGLAKYVNTFYVSAFKLNDSSAFLGEKGEGEVIYPIRNFCTDL